MKQFQRNTFSFSKLRKKTNSVQPKVEFVKMCEAKIGLFGQIYKVG